jgi:hypothetical protein
MSEDLMSFLVGFVLIVTAVACGIGGALLGGW